MNPQILLAESDDRSIVVSLAGNDIKLSAPRGVLTPDYVGAFRDHKPDIIRLLRLAEGLPVDDDAAWLLSLDEVDPADVPVCPLCGRYGDVQTLDDSWHCTPCDPLADGRKRRTERFLRCAQLLHKTCL